MPPRVARGTLARDPVTGLEYHTADAMEGSIPKLPLRLTREEVFAQRPVGEVGSAGTYINISQLPQLKTVKLWTYRKRRREDDNDD